MTHAHTFRFIFGEGKRMEKSFTVFKRSFHFTAGFLSAALLAGAVLLPATAQARDVKTATGIVINMLREGSGNAPRNTDTVKVHYRGTLADGTEFDSSYKRGQPASFPLNRVIPCWTEAVQTIKVGGKARLQCPPELAYGDRGVPGTIPPGATLTFEVELLDIVGR